MENSIQLSERPRREYIDVLRGLGIILVVLGHFMEYDRFVTPAFNAVWECIYMFHVALLCLCSGLVARFSVFKLIFQQLWLYLFSQGFMLWFRLHILLEEIDPAVMCREWLLPWRHMWYLYCLIFWELTVPLLRLARDKGKLPGAIAAMLAALAVSLLGGLRQWDWSLGRVFAAYPLFACGVLFRPQFDKLDEAVRRFWWLRPAALAVFAAWYLRWFLRAQTAPRDGYDDLKLFQAGAYEGTYTMSTRVAWCAAGILTAVLLLMILNGSKWLASVGKRTLPVYILHMVVYAWMSWLGFLETMANVGPKMTAVWLVFVTGSCVSLLASAPVCAVFNAITNVWYKGAPALVRRLQACLQK